ncbi:hypothetical protein KIH79_12625, partial [Bifidobacterium sp. 82T10]|nr:hypothetical protein [Bifidobacterium miconis]
GSAAVIVGVLLRRPVYALLGVMSSADRAAAGSRDAAAADGGHAAGMADVMSMNWFQAVGTCVLLTIAITATYLIALWLLRSRELIELARPLLARVTRRDNAASDGPDAAEHAVSDSTVQVPSTPPAPPAQSGRPAPDTALHAASASRSEAAAAPPSSTTPTVRMAPKPAASGPQSAQSQQSHQSSRYGANMKPQLGDTIINRYTLVSQLREAPGLLAWRASDRVLTRDCQLFIVTDSKVLSQVNSTAASLALMRDPRFTQVLQLQHDERIAIVVTQLDAGLSLSEYLRGPAGHILSFDAIRSIMGELTSAINMLLSQGLEHRAISTDTVRISTMGVQLADIPVSAMMADLTGGDPKLNDESLAVRQLAGVLYALLTHTPSAPGTTYDLGRIGDDVPGEFKLICKRGLGLRYDSEDRDLPMSSLAEIDALLGPWTPLNKLHERDIALPGVAGAETITNGVLSDVDPEDIMDVPSGVVSRVAMPPLAMEMPQYASALTSDDVVDVTPLAGDFFRAFDGSQSSSTVNNTTLSLDVSSIRHDAHHGVDAGAGAGAGVSGEATTVQPPVDPIAATAASSMPTVPIETHPQHPHAEPVATPVAPVPNVADTEEEGEKTMIIPPVNAPKPPSLPPAAAKVPYVNQIYKIESQDNDVSDEALLGSLPTKIVAIVVSIAVVVAAGYFAIQALNNDSTGNITNGSSNSADPWSQQNIDQVPFGNSTNGQSGSSDEDSSGSGSSGSGSSDKSSGSSSSDKSSSASSGSSSTKNTADKEAKKVPEPKYENNTPLTISSQNFQTNPGGQNGFAFSLHLDQPHKVYRMTITITSSGGTGYVRANTTGDPTKGEEVAKFSFAEGGTTEVKFDKVVTAQDLILWVPMDSMPGNQLYIQKVELF